MTTVVFLHIPKTAGQTIHNALVKAVGGVEYVSPVRTHTQAPNGPQMPAGYRLYSGHIDWDELGNLPQDRFVFSVLREPRERIASFYLYLLKEAQALSPAALQRPENLGKRRILEMSADNYFFGGDAAWQNFVRDHYDNFYCAYFATRKMRGRRGLAGLNAAEMMAQAREGLAQLDGLYTTTGLTTLETDIAARLGQQINVARSFHNTGGHAAGEARWPKLLALFERDSSTAKLAKFASLDTELMAAALSKDWALGEGR